MIVKVGNKKYVMNFGYGVMVGILEENVGYFFKIVRDFRY